MTRRPPLTLVAFSMSLAVAWTLPAAARDAPPTVAPTPDCAMCVQWNRPHAPARLFGNTWYVGTAGLSAVLVTSDAGHVLIDGGLPESAPVIEANIAALGFDLADVEVIATSHAHFDHAGGIALLQQRSGARVIGSAWTIAALRAGMPGDDDPQIAYRAGFPKITGATGIVVDGDVTRVGPIALTTIATPGHTPGGTSWHWRSCEGERCLDIVYADSLNPVSHPSYNFATPAHYPDVVADFRASHDRIAAQPCDLLVTAHPDVSDLLARLERRDGGAAGDGRDAAALIDDTACRRYADRMRTRLDERLAKDRAAK